MLLDKIVDERMIEERSSNLRIHHATNPDILPIRPSSKSISGTQDGNLISLPGLHFLIFKSKFM